VATGPGTGDLTQVGDAWQDPGPATHPGSVMEQMSNSDWWQRLFAAIDGKQAHDFATFLTEDGEFRFGNGPAVHGRAAVGAYVEGFFGMIGASKHQLVRAWHDDGTAVCEGMVTYTRLDGSKLTVPFVNVFYLRGDKIARYLIYIDNTPLFAAV
jgi:ketosteroid isomerase-like protein